MKKNTSILFTVIYPLCLTILLSGVMVCVEAKKLDALNVEGLLLVREEIVRDAVEIGLGHEFTPADVQESIRKLYATGQFRKVDFMIDAETDSSVSLTLSLEEYPIVDKVEFHGNKKIKKKALEEALLVGGSSKNRSSDGRQGRPTATSGAAAEGQLTFYQPLSDVLLHNSREKILEMYAEKGYLLAEVEAEVINTSVPGNAIVKYTIKEGPRVRVKSIEFKGNQEVTTRWLTRRLKTKENRWWRSGDFNHELYRSHLDTLMMQYQDKGMLDAAIEHDSVWYSEDKRDIYIEITVNEGRKYFMGDAAFTGNRILDSDTLLTRVALTRGRPFRKSQYEMTKFMIENAYREEGYLWARVEDRRTYRGANADTIDLVFEVMEGRPAIIRKIDVRGNSKTMEKVVRREITIMPGQRYKQSLMASSQQNIMRLNYFTAVVPDISPNDDGTIDLVFDITERDNIGQLTLGAAYSDMDGLSGTFSTSIPNFRGAGQELRFETQYGWYRRLAMVSFTEPWAWDTPWWLTGTVFYDWQSYTYSGNTHHDTTTSYGFRVGVGRSRLTWPDNKFRVQAIYQLSRERTTGREDLRVGDMSIVETGTMSKVRFNVERYDLDMPQFPNDGSRLTVTPEIAGLGGTFKFMKTTASYENYFRLPMKLVFGSEVKLGVITSLAGDLIISGNDLFTGGGAYGDAIIRGYSDWAFGGYRYRHEGDGISMFATNLSLRYPIVDQTVYLGVFADMGNTWPTISGIDIGDLYRGIGGGLRLNLPMIGLMGVDIGYGLDPVDKSGFDNKPEGWNWHIIMNKGF